MRAMLLSRTGPLNPSSSPLVLSTLPDPQPGPGEVAIGVRTCGVCHTELDEIEGRMPPSQLPIIPGHQVVGRVESLGPGVQGIRIGNRVGVAWIFSACGQCHFCRREAENLCPRFVATGRDVNGGYADRMIAPSAFVHPIPEAFSDLDAAPLLCAGAIGYRSLRLAGLTDGQSLGLTGFGASAHLVLKLARHQYPRSRIFVFTRSETERGFALSLGAAWAGQTDEPAPEPLQAIIDTTPAWTPIVHALGNLDRGGKLIVNAIRKDDTDKHVLREIDYPTHLWQEKEIKSVANVTRSDVREFLRVAAEIPLKPKVQEYSLEQANQALLDLGTRSVLGAKVLRVSRS